LAVIDHSAIGLRSIGAALPDRFVPLGDLQLKSLPETLAEFGFRGAAVADDVDSLLLHATRTALSDVCPDEIDAIFYASAISTGHARPSAHPRGDLLDSFCYRASWLQDALSLDRATVTGIAQQGCAGFFSALRQARALLIAEPDIRHVLCVGADVFDSNATREVLYNVVSDAACAAVVSREHPWARWVAYAQISKGYYWDVPVREAELIAAYFPTARAVIARVLERAGLKPAEIDLVIPTGVNAASWPILLRLCGMSESQLYEPVTCFGHTIAADSFLHLSEAKARGCLHAGMSVLLFTYGFGSSWCALVLEITGEVAA
jgi:3-oxoacyl-[acyl-carrier-protein] synthase-3